MKDIDAENPGRPRRHRLILVPSALLLAAVAVIVALYLGGIPNLPDPFTKPQSSVRNTNDSGTTLYTVTLRTLSSQTQASGTLGYSGAYTVVNQTQGTLTELPTPGQVIAQGQTLYQVNGTPVVLLYGPTPAYRTLSQGATGPDVQELNTSLVALGYVSRADVNPVSSVFTGWTAFGVEKLQSVAGMAPTGTLTLGEVAFLPGAARITGVQAPLGASAGAGQPLLTASSTSRQVTVDLSADMQADLVPGDQVEIALPDGKTTPGTVTSVGAIATTPSQGGSPTVPVLIAPIDPGATGTFDQAPVDVSITTATVTRALVVPTAALLARPGGGYAVEVVASHGVHTLVAVSLGLFDDADGLVQVTRTHLHAGQRVVVAP